MMNPWNFVAALAAVSLSSCGLSSEKKAVVARAGSIHGFPVPRATLMATLGLGNQPGDRHDVRIRGRKVSSSETWKHPAGLTIAAYATRLSRSEISDVLLGRNSGQPPMPDELAMSELPDELAMPDLPGEPAMPDLPGEPAIASTPPPRESFDRFVVKDGEKVLFRSDEAGRNP